MTPTKRKLYLLAVSAMLGNGEAFAFSSAPPMRGQSTSSSMRPMLQSNHRDEPSSAAANKPSKRRPLTAAASSLSDNDEWDSIGSKTTRISSALIQDLQNQRNRLLETTLLPVLSTSLLITGNTVGAGMLVLPELAAGPGMGISLGIFVGAFLINWISGLLIAQVAITQHDASGDEVPSSFKEFAQANLPMGGDLSANMISGISVLVNALVLAFNTAKVGEFGADALQGMLPGDVISLSWIVACIALVGTQSFTSLSSITSVLVFGLFASFAGLLVPGLQHMDLSPMELLYAPGTSPDVMASACQLAPIVLMSLVYQNIVPTVTKMLDYDRAKSMAAITLGSFLPLGMYVAWAFCVVGGGLAETSSTLLEGPLMAMFTLTTIAGSSIGCVMSLAEEFDTFVKAKKEPAPLSSMENTIVLANTDDDDKFSFVSVLLSVACAGVALQFFQHDLNGALKVAGSFGSPLLYGVLPVVMAYTQRQARATLDKLPKPLLPALELPNASLGLLGVASTGFVGNELLQSAHELLAATASTAAPSLL